jgi:hypothetical protein
MVSISNVFLIWTAVVALLLSVFALADNQWPDEVSTVTFHKRFIAIVFYLFTIVAASITLWATYQSGGAPSGLGGGY